MGRWNLTSQPRVWQVRCFSSYKQALRKLEAGFFYIPFKKLRYNIIDYTNYRITVKAQLSHRGAYLVSDLPEGGLIDRGLIRNGGLFTKSSDSDIFGSFSVLLSHILRNQDAILRLNVNSTQSLFPNMPKLTGKVV